FATVSAASGLDLIDDGRAIASSDWDGDGDLDFWLVNRTAPRLRLLRNKFPAATAGASVSLDLQGTTCNRDAIGAVVELRIGDRKLTRVVTAGDGFMSQSGKRLHFGLAGAPEGGAATATVFWPGGAAETFPGIAPGARYRLVQGSGTAVAAPKALPVNLTPGPIEAIPPTEIARVVMTERHPATPIDYVDFSGQVQRVGPESTAGSPVLINVWASWCPPCVAELTDFAEHYEALRAKGLRIVALTTEAVSQDGSKPDISHATALVKKSAYPFDVGATDANGLRLLTLLHNKSFVRERPLPLPASFLIDRHGRLAVLYRGQVSAERLLADLELLDAAPAAIERAAFPFSSRDGLELFRIGDLDFAKAYLDGGYIEDARAVARKAIDAADVAADPANRARAWYFLGTLEQGARQWSAAAKAYRKAIEFAPAQPLLKIPLGVVLWQEGATAEADKAFAEAAAAQPDSAPLMDGLGKAHLQIDRPDAAIRYFERALELAPENPRHQFSLALAHEKAGSPREAVARYEAILKTHPQSAEAKNNLAWLLATCPDASVRDGQRAVTLASEITGAPGTANPPTLDTLAAAQAETGDFAAAVATLQSAIPEARASGMTKVAEDLQRKLALYKQRRPFRSEKS
ncbi:MAG: tetratricopeptide repeat protein, partial [Verrucomicrobiales bacterium]